MHVSGTKVPAAGNFIPTRFKNVAKGKGRQKEAGMFRARGREEEEPSGWISHKEPVIS